jgi:mannosyltransferase
VATVLNVFLLLLVCAHLVVVAGLPRSRRTTTAWAVAVGSATALAAPFLVFTQVQRSQVDWIWPVGPGTLGQILFDQYFPAVYSRGDRVSDPNIGQQVTPELVHAMLVVWGLVAPFIVAVTVIAIVGLRRRRNAAQVVGRDTRLFVAIAAAWIVVPTLILVLYSIAREPIYHPR